MIANFENNTGLTLDPVIEVDEGATYNDPIICAQFTKKKKCDACLLGYH